MWSRGRVAALGVQVELHGVTCNQMERAKIIIQKQRRIVAVDIYVAGVLNVYGVFVSWQIVAIVFGFHWLWLLVLGPGAS